MTVTEATLPSCKKKMCTEETIENVTKDVMEGILSLRHAAAQYDIPPSTLHNHISGKVSAGAVSGALCYLDEDKGKELIKFLLGCAEWLHKTVEEDRVANSQ